MALQEIYRGEFYSFNGVKQRVSIYDTNPDSGLIRTDLTLNSTGYLINWNAGISDIVSGGIIESECEISIENQEGVLDYLLEALLVSEGRFLVRILRDEEEYWQGVILQDFGGVEDSPQGTVTLHALDGLGFLKTELADDYGSNPTKESFLGYIIGGLNYIQTQAFYGDTDVYVKIRTDWYSYNMDTAEEPLDQIVAVDDDSSFLWQDNSIKKGYDGSDIEVSKNKSYWDVINHIMVHFNSILMKDNGAWYIFQRDLLEDNNTIAFKKFDKVGRRLTGTVTETVYNEVGQGSNGLYRGGGSFDNLPGLKSVDVTYLAQWQNSMGVASLIPNIFGLGDTPTTAITLLTGTGNKIDVAVNFKDTYDLSACGVPGTVYTAPSNWGFSPSHVYFAITPRYKVQVKLIGASSTYYMKEDGSWVTSVEEIVVTPNHALWRRYYWVYDDLVPSWTGALYDEKNWIKCWWNVISDDIPVDGTVSVEINRYDLFSSTPNDPWVLDGLNNIATDTFAMIPTTHLFYIYGNQTILDYVYFKETNTDTSYSLEHTIEDNLFGTRGQATRGLLAVWDNINSIWVPSLDDDSKLWEKGAGSTKDKFFNELLVREFLVNQNRPLLVFNGSLYDRRVAGDMIFGFQVIELEYKEFTYRLAINNVTYNPQMDSWSGDWIETNRDRTYNQIGIQAPVIFEPVGPPDDDQSGTLISNLVPIEPSDGGFSVGKGKGSMSFGGGKLTPSIPTIPSNQRTIYNIGSTIISVDTDGTRLPLDSVDLPIYGFLYTWTCTIPQAGGETLSSGGGWDVPTAVQAATLNTYISGSGNSLKSKRQVASTQEGAATSVHPRWDSDTEEGLNTYNFNALPGGQITGDTFGNVGEYGEYWSQTESGATGFRVRVDYDSDTITTGYVAKARGLAIKLVRAATTAEQALDDGTFVDNYVGNDGRQYGAVKVGTQVWMSENLMETKWNDGSDITENTSTWSGVVGSAYCKYDYDEDYAKIYHPAYNSIANLEDLSDVDITSISDDDILQYNSTTGKWENETLPITAAVWTDDGTDVKPVNVTRNVDTEGYYKQDGVHILSQNTTLHNLYLGYTNIAATGSYNIFAGEGAGNGNTSGAYNTNIGYQAARVNITGSRNMAIGYEALYNNTVSDNFAMGYQALKANTTGLYNVGLGNYALTNITSGNSNIAIGYEAAKAVTTNSYNVAIGAYALKYNDVGGNIAIGYNAGSRLAGAGNVAIGHSALLGSASTSGANYNVGIGQGACQSITTGDYNQGIGFSALQLVTSGGSNIAFGTYALAKNTTASYNTAIGYATLFNNITGQRNIAIGHQSLYSNTVNDNVGIGYRACRSNTTGYYNVGIGYDALYTNQTSVGNIAIGAYALKVTTSGYNTAIGYASQIRTTTGTENMAIGYYSMVYNTTGSYNLALGNGALYTQTTASNNTAIGYRAGYLNVTGSGCVYIGYQAGYNETNSNRLYVSNSNTTSPLIYGEFDTSTHGNSFLQINDVLILNPIASAPTSPVEGMIYADSTTNKLCYYDGTSWNNLF